jgi:3-hydroxyisobutyrate dehydrogenase
MSTRIGIVGLGAMGLPIAHTLRAKGYEVIGYDPSHERLAMAPVSAMSVEALIADCSIILLSLPSSKEVETVVAGQILPHARSGLMVIDCSTADPRSTRMLHEACTAAGVGFVDAPLSGGPKGAAEGRLLVMAGGAARDVERAMPVLEAMARRVVRCGGPGAGHVVKLVNNMLCAAHLALAGEALRLGEAAGVDAATLVEALNAGSGRSGVTEVNMPAWILSGAFDSGFTMGLMRKDVKLAHDVAVALGALGPMSERAAELWRESAATLDNAQDFNRMAEATWKTS